MIYFVIYSIVGILALLLFNTFLEIEFSKKERDEMSPAVVFLALLVFASAPISFLVFSAGFVISFCGDEEERGKIIKYFMVSNPEETREEYLNGFFSPKRRCFMTYREFKWRRYSLRIENKSKSL